MVYYLPELNVYYRVIGSFDYDNILKVENDLLNKSGALIQEKMSISKQEISLNDVDCAALDLGENLDDDEEFAAMLAELLAEEEAQKESLGLDEEPDRKKKVKKKTKKKKPSSAKDEL